jgi:hypothetical protein
LVVVIGVVRASPDELNGVMAGLVPAIHVVRRIDVRERGKGEALWSPPVGAVFEVSPAWIAGTSPAMTRRAETNSKPFKSTSLTVDSE